MINTNFHHDDPVIRLFSEIEAGTLEGWSGVR